MPPELFVMVRTHYKQLKSMNVYRKLQSIHSVLEGNFETDLYIFRIEKFLECTGGYFGVLLEFLWNFSFGPLLVYCFDTRYLSVEF